MSSSRLNIAFVIDDLGFGGAQRQLSILAAALARTDVPVVFCLSPSTHPFAGHIRDAGVEVVELPRSHGFDLRRLGLLARAFDTRGIDVVHGFLDAANVYAYAAARRSRRPCVLSLRNERLRLRGVRAWLLERALRRADQVVANSRAGVRFLVDETAVPPGRVTLIPNAVSPGLEPPTDPPARGSSPVIGFVGRLTAQKQVGLLLDAFALVTRKLPDARLVIAGDGPDREKLAGQARRLGIDNAVEFTGHVEDPELRMARFSCLALPSAYEGFPNVAMEAVALGVPVVAAAAGDVEDIVLDGRTGHIAVDPTPESFSDLLLRTVNDDALRHRAYEEGPALIRSKYSVESSVEKLRAVYTAAIR
jgi:glycosyltransferase involved in cell wall biosynthesis